MSIINNSYNFVFVHVPKSAGTSVAQFFSQFSTYKDIEVGASQFGESVGKFYAKRFGLTKHATFGEISQVVGEAEMEKYVSFGFSRNPYDRAVSFFTFLRKWKGWQGHEQLQKITDVNQFLASDFFYDYGPDRLFRPQAFWLRYKRTSLTKCVDYIGKLETMDQDINELANIIGLNLKKPDLLMMEAKNSSRNFAPDLQLQLDSNSIKLINSKYAVDFDLLNYEVIE